MNILPEKYVFSLCTPRKGRAYINYMSIRCAAPTHKSAQKHEPEESRISALTTALRSAGKTEWIQVGAYADPFKVQQPKVRDNIAGAHMCPILR